VAILVLVCLPVQTKSLNCYTGEVLRSIGDYFLVRAIENYFPITEDYFPIRSSHLAQDSGRSLPDAVASQQQAAPCVATQLPTGLIPNAKDRVEEH